MQDESFADACLVLVGHGSTGNAESSVPVRQLVEDFRRRKRFGHVCAGFWKEVPPLSAVLAGIADPRVFVVPFFISEGYFSEEVVPRELGFRSDRQKDFDRVRKRGDQILVYCKPVGTHPHMTRVVLSRARAVVEAHPFPRVPRKETITLFIAGHGTDLNQQSRRSVEHQTEKIRREERYADVHAVFLEEAPRIADCYTLAKTRHIVMVPFFLSEGLHVREDIPLRLGEPEKRVQARLAEGQPTWKNPTERRGKLVWYSAAVGTDPVLAEVVLDRVREAARWLLEPGR